MPFIQRKDGRCGPLNNSITVGELFKFLAAEIKRDPRIINKAVLVSDDEEGNCYHGVYFMPSTSPEEVKGLLEGSNGGPADQDDYENAIIIS